MTELNGSRAMRKLMMATPLAVLALLVLAMPVAAGRNWCMKDPIVRLNGTDLQVWVGVPEEYVYLVNGPIEVTFKTPRDVSRELIFVDEGFNGYGESVEFGDLRNAKVLPSGMFNVEIRATVPIDEKLAQKDIKEREIPLRIVIVEGNQQKTVDGMNDGTVLKTKVKGSQ